MKVLTLATFFWVSMGLAFGEIRRIETQSLSPDALTLRFHCNPTNLEGAKVNNFFSAWGLTFATSDRRVLTLENRRQFFRLSVNQVPCDPSSPVVRNRAPGPLILNFELPVKRVGFWLAGNRDTTVTVNAFDDAGTSLGTVQHQGLKGAADFDPAVFVGIELTESGGSSSGISKVTISFSIPFGVDQVEELDELIFDFVSRPGFRSFLAQIADGRFPGGRQAYQTIVTIANPTRVAVGTLSFFDSSGAPLFLSLDGSEASEFEFAIPPGTSKTFVTSGTRPSVVAGYARVDSSSPVTATAIFRVVDLQTGEVLSEAGVGSDTGKVTATASVFRSVTGKADAGVAIVNTSDTNALVIVKPVDESGKALAVPVSFQLGPREHTARFVTQLFPELSSIDFSGAIGISASQPLAIVILKTKAGIPTSGLPVGSTQLR